VLKAFEMFYDKSAGILNKTTELLRDSSAASTAIGLGSLAAEKTIQGIGAAAEVAPLALVGIEGLKYWKRKRDAERGAFDGDDIDIDRDGRKKTKSKKVKGQSRLSKLKGRVSRGNMKRLGGTALRSGSKILGPAAAIYGTIELSKDIGGALRQAYDDFEIRRFTERLAELDEKRAKQRVLEKEKIIEKGARSLEIDAKSTINIYGSKADAFSEKEIGVQVSRQVESAIKPIAREAYLFDE
jgi:hypothetical protein